MRSRRVIANIFPPMVIDPGADAVGRLSPSMRPHVAKNGGSAETWPAESAKKIRITPRAERRRRRLLLLEHRAKGLASFGRRVRLLGHDDLRLWRLRRGVAVEVEILTARLLDGLA